MTVGAGVCMVAALVTGGIGLSSGDADAVSIGELPDAGPAAVTARQVGQPGPPPASIEIPSIKVSSELDDLRLLADDTLAVPRDADRAGWWSQGPRPGDPGPAVIVGHVDAYDGPGVFLLLHQLQPGAEIVVRRNDGTSVVFAVDAVRQFSKDEFPTDLVYGTTAEPTLRLITCGGSFDRSARTYTDNVVVFAHLRTADPS